MAAPDVKEAQKQQSQQAPERGVLFFSIYPNMDLPIHFKKLEVIELEDGKFREREVKKTRSFYFKQHRAMVTNEQANEWRKRHGYGISFIEAYPHKDIPKGALSLVELLDPNNKRMAQAQQFFKQLEHHSGRVFGEQAALNGFKLQNEVLNGWAKMSRAG